MKIKYNNIFLFLFFTIISIFSYFLIIKYGNYLFNNGYIGVIKENYLDYGSPLFSHNVNQPINITYSCNNMCSSQSKCYLTGEQCTSDIDCYGCKPHYKKEKYLYDNIIGQNDSGKYSYLTPQYSPLTNSGNYKIYNTKNKFSQTPQLILGPNLWKKSANYGSQINKNNSSFIWSPTNSLDKKFVPKYPIRYSTTGVYNDYGPLPSNSYLS